MQYLSLFFIFLSVTVWSQTTDSVSLQQCYVAALKAQPLNQNADLYSKLSDMNVKSFGTAWLPTITLAGQATWQSDVTKVDISLPPQLASSVNFPSPSKEQYKATVELRQTIYDGGLTKNRKQVEIKDGMLNILQVSVDASKVKETINNLYFSYILSKELSVQLESFDLPLQARRVTLESAVKNGIALPTDLDAIDAERLSLQQKKDECEIAKQSALKILSVLTADNSLLESKSLVNPQLAIVDSNTIKRAELLVMDAQKNKIDASIGVLQASRMPKVFAFSTLGYGNPGLNMFKTGWKTYGIIGVGFSWNVIDWGKTNNDKQVLSIQKSIVDTRKQDFVRNITIALEGKKAEMLKMVSQIANDEKLVELRTKITKVITKQVEQGTATNFDFINQLSKENDARILLQIHRVQLQKLMADYLITIEN
jgi:outer membrane protein TolC